MSQRTYFDQQTGQIITSVSGDLDLIDLSAYESYPSIEAFGDAQQQYVENGVLVNMPEKPFPQSIFNFQTKSWSEMTVDLLEKNIKNQRNLALVSSDWTQLADVTNVDKQAWSEYRQALRDITSQSGYPTNVVWPTPPQG